MSSASLTELFAGRTELQGDMLMEQHVGKSVRVSGEVTEAVLVPTTRIARVMLKSSVTLIAYFDPADDYDPVPIVLALNEGDRISVSGQISQLKRLTVALDHCKLLNVRGRTDQ